MKKLHRVLAMIGVCGVSAVLIPSIHASTEPDALSQACGVYLETSDFAAIVIDDAMSQNSVLIAVGAHAGNLHANDSSVTSTVTRHSLVKDATTISKGDGARAEMGSVLFRNTTLSGTASSRTVASQTVVIATGENAAAYVGGIHAK